MDSFDSWALSLVVFVPIVGVVAMMFIPRSRETALKATALLTTLVTAGLGVYLLVAFDYGKSRALQFQVDKSWIEVINSRYHIGLDGISLPLLALSSRCCASSTRGTTSPSPTTPRRSSSSYSCSRRA
jgi:NADH-quinone oxidoreductase subunit M